MATTAQQKAVEFGEDTARLHFYLGIVYSSDIQTHFTDAVREFEKAAEMDSQNALPMLWLAYVYAQKQENEAVLVGLKTLETAGRRQKYTLYFPTMPEEYTLALPPYLDMLYPTSGRFQHIMKIVLTTATAYTANGKSEKAIDAYQTLFDYGQYLIGSQPSNTYGLMFGNNYIAEASRFLLRFYEDYGMEEKAKQLEKIVVLNCKSIDHTNQKLFWQRAPGMEWVGKCYKSSSIKERLELCREGRAVEVRVAGEIAKEFLAEWEGQ